MIERFEVLDVRPLADGRAFGARGGHVIERGVAHGVVDPAHAANARVVDLAHAADVDGLVRYRADYRLVRLEQGDELTKLLAVVPNRGMTHGVPFARGLRPGFGMNDGDIDAGDGFVLERGWSVLWCGWQWARLAAGLSSSTS